MLVRYERLHSDMTTMKWYDDEVDMTHQSMLASHEIEEPQYANMQISMLWQIEEEQMNL